MGAEPDYDAMTYEQLLDVLEELTARMASGDVGIEQATELYERADRLHTLAAERLEKVQDRIARLTPGDGEPATGT